MQVLTESKVNFLLIESLERLHVAYGDEFQIEVPTGSGNKMSLKAASVEIARRLQKLFIPVCIWTIALSLTVLGRRWEAPMPW